MLEEEAFSHVIREAQELVELALKGLRHVGVDPPKWHEVGPILIEHQDLLPEELPDSVPRLSETSKRLRGEREFAFYGDVNFISTEDYTNEDALEAIQDARFVLEKARSLIRRNTE